MINQSNGTSAYKKASWLGTFWLLSFFSAIFIFVWIWPLTHPFEQPKDFLPLHTILELTSVVIAAMIFAMGWQAYMTTRAINLILIASAFLAVALLDTGHLLSYLGMPDFVSTGSSTKSINFWLSARFIAAMALLIAVCIGWKPYSTARIRYFIASICMAYVAFAYWLILPGLFAR